MDLDWFQVKRTGSICLILIPFFIGCAGYHRQYALPDEDWKSIEIPSSEEVNHTTYLVGDAGNAPEGGLPEIFPHLQKTWKNESNKASLVWLGDNIYPVGLAPEGHRDHPLGKHRLSVQAEISKDFPGNVHFIPGNHDWYTFGKEGLARQEELVENLLEAGHLGNQEKKTYFIPDDGCPGPVINRVSDEMLILAIDSHWYLSSARKNNADFSHCPQTTIAEFESAFKDVFIQHPDNFILLVTHHPLYTYGKHGGHYKLKYNIFPLTQLKSWLLVPLPFSGIIANKMRAVISEQDTKHPDYREYQKLILQAAISHGNTLVASGHEHNLQYIIKKDVPIVVSGAGSKKSAVTLDEGSRFAVGSYGYCVILHKSDGSKVLQFFAYDELQKSVKEVYRSIIP